MGNTDHSETRNASRPAARPGRPSRPAATAGAICLTLAATLWGAAQVQGQIAPTSSQGGVSVAPAPLPELGRAELDPVELAQIVTQLEGRVEYGEDGPKLRLTSRGATRTRLLAAAASLESVRMEMHRTLDLVQGFRDLGGPVGPSDGQLTRYRTAIDGLNLEELSAFQYAMGRAPGWAEANDKLEAALAAEAARRETVVGNLNLPQLPSIASASGIVPTPVYPTPYPADSDFTPDDDMMAGDFPPAYAAVCFYSPDRSSSDAGAALVVVVGVLEGIDAAIGFLCNLNIDILGFGATNLPGCIAGAVSQGVLGAINIVKNFFDYCDATIDSAEIEAGYENTRRIMARLNNHSANTIRDMNYLEVFAHDFERFDVRGAVQANLASVDDEPVALFMLPGDFCRPLQGDPIIRFTDLDGEEINREQCGLLEMVEEILAQSLALAQESGQPIGNALDELAAGESLRDLGDYKGAYARYRKAYRELSGMRER